MKIDRQIGILSVLLQKETVTASYIPIVTKQGVNGGIAIIESFKLDKTLFTQGEMQDIIRAGVPEKAGANTGFKR